MYGGGLAVMAWFFLMPNLKQNKISVEVNGLSVYSNTKIVSNQIITSFADQADVAQLIQQNSDFD